MLDYLRTLAAPVLFLKATAKKQVWIPQFTKKNGQVVGGHYAMVHVADDHDHAKVAGGSGTYSQKKAHAQLKDEPGFGKLSPEDQAALVMHHATQIQDAESMAARLATLKKKLLAGQKPTAGEWKYFHAAPADKQQAITEAVHSAGHGALMDAEYAAYVGAQPPANEAPAEAAPPAPAPEAKKEPQSAAEKLVAKVSAGIKESSEAKAFGKKIIEDGEKLKAKYAGKPVPPMAQKIIDNAEKMAEKMAKHAPKAEPAKPAGSSLEEAKAAYNAKMEAKQLPTLKDGHGGEYWVLNTGATNENGELFVHLADKVHGSMQANGFTPKQLNLYVNPGLIKDPKKAAAAAAQQASGLAMPEYAEGKTTTGVKKYYEGVSSKIMAMAAAGDVTGLEAMPQPEKGSWGGKTANSKKLLELHAAALAQAKGGAAPAPEAKGDRASKFAEAKKDPHKDLAAEVSAAGWPVMVGSKGVLLASSPDYPKTYANQTQAANAAQKLFEDGFDAEVIGHHPYMVKIHGKMAGGAKADAGPKEGDTKQGKGGTLVLKDGHWVLQAQGTPALAYLTEAVNTTATVKEATKEWIAAHPGQEAELHSALVTLGFDEYAKDYEPAKPAPADGIPLELDNVLAGAISAKEALAHAQQYVQMEGSTKEAYDTAYAALKKHKYTYAVQELMKQQHDAPKATAADDDTPTAEDAAIEAFGEKLMDAALPESNTNAKSFNAKLQAIHDAFNAGDKAALLGMSYGTNTYGKKAAVLANEALALLGARHQVEPGQKAGAHPKYKVTAIKQGAPAAAPAAAPAPAVAGPVPPAMASLNGSAQMAVEAAQDAFAAGDLAKLEILDASTTGLYSFNSTNKYIKECIAHLQAGDKQQALIGGWKAAIGSGKVPTKEQAEAMDALKQANLDQYMDDKAEAYADLAIHMGMPMEDDMSPIKAENEADKLHAQAKGSAPAAAPDVGLTDADIAKVNAGGVNEEMAVKLIQLAKAGDLAGLEAYVTELAATVWPTTAAYGAALATLLEKKQGKAPAAALPKNEIPDYSTAVDSFYGAQAIVAAKKGDIGEMLVVLDKVKNDPPTAEYVQQLLGLMQDKGGTAVDPAVVKAAASAKNVPALQALMLQAVKNGQKQMGMDIAAMIQKINDGEEQGPKDGDTKQGANGMLVFKDGRWHKMGDDPKVLKQKAASVPMPKLKGTNSIKLGKAMKQIKAAAEAEGAEGVAKLVKLTPSGHVVIKGFKTINPDGSAYGPAAEAAAKYAKAMVAAMAGTKGSGAPVDAPAAPAAAPKASTAPAATVISTKTEKVGKVSAMIADGWEQTGPQKGSNPGGKFKDSKGQEWYCKFPSDPDTVKNELLAAKFYQMLGMDVPELRLVKKDGKLGIASKWVDGLKTGAPADLAKAEGAHKGFVFDAWLANWDVVGLSNDNMLLNKDGKAVRVDVGGSLVYRAQGGKKGDAFGTTVTELDTLLDPAKNSQSAAVFGKITPADLNAGGEVLAKMHPNQIDKLCRTFGPGTRVEQEELAAKLVARREFILKKLGITDPWNAPAPDITKLKVNVADLPPPIDFNNYPGKGGGLSSKKHINDQNTIDDAALIEFAKQGNLKALQDYHYDAYDKDTGAYLGKKPIGQHPAKDIKNHHAALCDLLTAIAHPPVEGLDMPPIGGGSIEEVSEAAGFIKPGDNISTISADKVIGFWMKLGHVGADAVKDLMPPKTSYLKTDFVAKAKKWYQGASSATKALVNSIQDSGYANRFWNKGDKTISIHSGGHSYSGGAQSLANTIYNEAYEFEEGETVGRWMNLPDTMKQQLLKEGAGLVFQNADSMCTSIFKNWGDNAKFGSGAYLNIRFAKGAKAMASLGSGRFSSSSTNAEGEYVHTGGGEMEVTTLMGQRFVVLGVKQGNASSPNGITLDLLALPPHEGFTAAMGEMAAMGKALPAEQTTALRKPMVVFVKRIARNK